LKKNFIWNLIILVDQGKYIVDIYYLKKHLKKMIFKNCETKIRKIIFNHVSTRKERFC